MKVLVFSLGDSRYGVTLGHVERIVRAVELTRLPDAPPVVEGVVDVYGVVRPVFDMRRGLGLPPREVYVDDHYILASAAGRAVVLHVDEVVDVIDVPPHGLLSVDGVGEDNPRIAGLGRLHDGLVVIHELDAFLSQAQTAALDAALAVREQGSQGRA